MDRNPPNSQPRGPEPSMTPVETIRSVSSLLEDAELATQKLSHKEVQLIRETEDLFKQQVIFFKRINELRNSVPNMDVISNDTNKLRSLVESSSTLVEDVCNKFRRIDSAKVRLEDCLSKIDDVLDLKTCRDGVINAMKSNNYEEAAMHIKRFLAIDQQEFHNTVRILCPEQSKHSSAAAKRQTKSSEIIDKDGFIVDPKALSDSLTELAEAKRQLVKLCQDSLTDAIKDNNLNDIDRFFKIFPILGEHSDGLSRYADYIKSKIVNQQVDEAIRSKEKNQADKLAALYENIAKIIDSHQPLIETYYGPGHLMTVVRVIQKECDRLSRKLLEEFRNETKLQEIAKIVRSVSLSSSNPSNATASNPNTSMNPSSKLDLKTVDKLLSEISLIVSRSEVYLDFVVQRIREDIRAKSSDEAQFQACSVQLYNMVFIECELNHLVQEVGGIYVMLEQYYLNESSKKAITMDQIVYENDHLISSMLDDIFFILKKCTKRAISTKSNEVFCAIINHCVTLLESTFCHVLEERLRNQQYYGVTNFNTKNLDLSQAYNVIQSGRYLQSANELEASNAQYFSALNNLDKACSYIVTLKKILDVDVRKLRPSLDVTGTKQEKQLEKSLTCLNEMLQLVEKFTSVINSSLYQLFNTSLRSKVKAELKNLMNENPELRSLAGKDSSDVSSLAGTLLSILDLRLERNLNKDNYQRLSNIVRDFLCSSLSSIK